MGTCHKVIISRHIIEVYEYDRVLFYDEKKDKPVKDEKREDRTEEKIIYSKHRTRQNVRRLILNNFDNRDKFITLTFAENVTDVEVANKEFKKFVQRVKRQCENLKYIAVIEFQDRGAVHYHMICNIPVALLPGRDDKEKERNFQGRYWKNGFVKIKDITGIDNVGAYLIKYLQKSLDDVEGVSVPENKKRYLCSKNLNKPIEVDSENMDDVLRQVRMMFPVFTNSYMSEYNGLINYREYNLLRRDSYKDEA
jgi:hypothetical protein